MRLDVYLFFNGQARAAIETYARIFNVPPPEMMTMDQAGPEMEVPPERADWIMHAAMPFDGATLMISDDHAANSAPMDGCNVSATLSTLERAREVFDALAEGGEVRMTFGPTFWSAGFGVLSDRFGTRWMISCEDEPAG